ncbi:uncharacterized protein LOC128802801 isoform X4 [Vidua macroura]|uniref:uncharacterized protein LOC128802801 isoform X4 n=1 Tax=Vidua macroura TaxID=187451 RepID=UPI0023A8F29B|nr:uncharacterized protein LOC128802801 isoform X4 [Vidua macroura]
MGELLREGPGLPVGAALPFPGLLWDLVPPAPWAAPGWGRTPLEPTLLQQGPPGMRLEGAWEPLPARGRRNGNIWNCLEQLQLHFVSRWSQKVTLAFVERPRTRGRPPPPRPTRFPDKPTALFQAGFGAEGSATSGADKAAAPGQRHPHPPPQKKKIQPRWGDGESRAGVPSVQTTCSGGKGCTVVCTLVTPARAAPEPELPQESDSAVSTNQYSLEPPFMMLMLLMPARERPCPELWGSWGSPQHLGAAERKWKCLKSQEKAGSATGIHGRGGTAPPGKSGTQWPPGIHILGQ